MKSRKYGKHRISNLLFLAVLIGIQSSAIVPLQAESRIGLGVTGQNPMNFVAEKISKEVGGYIRVINDGGTATGYYQVSMEGEIALLGGWNISVDPQSFYLEPNESRKIDVSIKFPEEQGEYSGRLRVSAHRSGSNGAGNGVAEIFVPVSVTLTPISSISYHIKDSSSINTTNPLIIDAKEIANVELTLSEISASCCITIRNVTALPGNIDSPAAQYKVIGSYIEISVDTTVRTRATLKVYYGPQQLAKEGLNENSLKLFYWSDGRWVRIEQTFVNVAQKYVWAEVDHFGYWALMVPPPETTFQWWYIGVVVIITVIAVSLLRRYKNLFTRH